MKMGRCEMIYRLCYNGQQVSEEYATLKEAAKAQLASGDSYAVTWIQFYDGFGEWFPVSRKKVAKWGVK